MAASLAASIIAFLQQEPRFQAVNELRLVIDDQPVGWVRPSVAEALYELDRPRIRITGREIKLSSDATIVGRSAQLQDYALAMKQQGLLQNWRNEAMQLQLAGQVFLTLERAAFRTFGLQTPSVHLNAWVATANGVELWVARRSRHKFVDPNKLDNLVGGGLSANESISTGLAREAWEEAGLELKQPPRPFQFLHIHRRIPEGVQDESVAVHDLWLPAHHQPENQDGEVASLERLPIAHVLPHLLAGEFTWDAGLVVLSGLLRQRYFGAENAAIAHELRRLGYWTSSCL